MAQTDKRAAAPGKQRVRTDNIKDKSWADPQKKDGLVAQIFFGTNVTALDNQDMAELEKLINPYQENLRNYDREIPFIYSGYADFRPSEEGNGQLSLDRAQGVAAYLGAPERLGGFQGRYVSTVRGNGVDLWSMGLPADAGVLTPYRRVDVYAPPPRRTPNPDPPPQKAPLPEKMHWLARMGKGGGGSKGVSVETFTMDIVDEDNEWRMEFRYFGEGPVISVPSLPFSYTGSPSDWVPFDTSVPVTLWDFEGFAVHSCVAAQAGVGPALDMVWLNGPWDRKGADQVFVAFYGFAKFEKSVNTGAGFTIGTLTPKPETLTNKW
jgi:hypothetical protein